MQPRPNKYETAAGDEPDDQGRRRVPVTWPIIPVLASTNDGPYHPIGYCLGVIKNSIFSTEDATIGRTLFSL